MQKTCPICGKAFSISPLPESFPFCSGRCKLVDLGNWIDGRYRVPAQDDEVFSENTEISPSRGEPEVEKDLN